VFLLIGVCEAAAVAAGYPGWVRRRLDVGAEIGRKATGRFGTGRAKKLSFWTTAAFDRFRPNQGTREAGGQSRE
jgi:hypothetical protein